MAFRRRRRFGGRRSFRAGRRRFGRRGRGGRSRLRGMRIGNRM